MARYHINQWPSPVGLTEKERHAQTKRVLAAAWRFIIKKGNERIVSISQVAAGLGVALGEIRDEARTWHDTNITYCRVAEALRSRLYDFMFAGEGVECQHVRRGAQKVLEMNLAERQLEADNTKMVRTGTSTIINIVNYAAPGKAKRLGEPKAKAKPAKKKGSK